MTIRLLAAYGIYPCNAIVTLDSPTEAGLIAAKQALADTTGGTPYVAPVLPEAIDETKSGSAGTDSNGNVLTPALLSHNLVTGGSELFGTTIATGLVFDSKAAAAENITKINKQFSVGGQCEIPADGAILWLADSIKLPSNTVLNVPQTLIIKGAGHSMEIFADDYTIALDGNGGIASVAFPVTKPGNFTMGAPTAFVGGAFFEPAEIWAYADGTSQTFVDVFIANPGRGYHTAPTLTFDPAPSSQGVGAQQRHPSFTATVANGSVTAVTIVDAGLKYPYKGWYPIRAKGGMHARLTVVVDGAGVAQSVTVDTPGLDYNDVPLGNLKFHMIGGNTAALAPLCTNADWFNGNENIKVFGGIWDGNVDETNPAYHYDEFAGMCFLFISCDNTVVQPSRIQNCVRYGFHFFDCWNTRVLAHTVSNGFDNVHFTGANRHAYIDGLYGATGDDFTTATALERPIMDFYAGDIRHITCSNYSLSGSAFALAAWSGQRPDGTSYNINDINFNNMQGLANGRLLRLDTVDTAMNNSAIDQVRINFANMQWPDSFTGSELRSPGYGPMIQISEVTVNELVINNFVISNKLSTTAVTPQVLDVGTNGILKHLTLSAFCASFACAPSQELFNFASAGGAPETVRLINNSRITFGSTATTAKYAFKFGGYKPTKLFDIGNSIIENIGVATASTFSAGDWNISSNGAYLYQNHASATGFSYAGVVKYSCVGTRWMGTQRAFAAASASDNIDYLYWEGSGNTVACTPHESNSRGRLYPKDYSLPLSITHLTNNTRIAKLAGNFFTNTANAYGIVAGPVKCGNLLNGSLAWVQEVTNVPACAATVTAGGTGYVANEWVGIAKESALSHADVSIRIGTVTGGAVTTLLTIGSLSFITGPSGSALPITGGSGSGATLSFALV